MMFCPQIIVISTGAKNGNKVIRVLYLKEINKCNVNKPETAKINRLLCLKIRKCFIFVVRMVGNFSSNDQKRHDVYKAFESNYCYIIDAMVKRNAMVKRLTKSE